jgi:hypothetical protein
MPASTTKLCTKIFSEAAGERATGRHVHPLKKKKRRKTNWSAMVF